MYLTVTSLSSGLVISIVFGLLFTNTMPRCEGLPDGRCPAQVNDNTVKIGKGDLMLCPKCDDERRRPSSVQADNASGTNGAEGRRDIADNAVSVPGPQPGTDADNADDADDTPSLKQEYSGIIVNELLCYVFNRIDILPIDELVNVVSCFYDDSEVFTALLLLKDIISRLSLTTKRRLPRRTGRDKKLKSVEDICTLMHDFSVASVDSAAASLPSFVAFKLSRLPAVDTSHFDVSTLSHQFGELRSQVNAISSSAIKDELSSLRNLMTESVLSLSSQIQQIPIVDFTAGHLRLSDDKELADIRKQMGDVTNVLHSLSSQIAISTSQQSSVEETSAVICNRFSPLPGEPRETSDIVTIQPVVNLTSESVEMTSVTTASSNTVSELDPAATEPVETQVKSCASQVDDYTLVVNRKNYRRKRKPVIGTNTVPSRLQSLQPDIGERSLFVTRLPPSATVEDLTEFVSRTFKLHASCTKIVSGRYHSSFKVTVRTAQPKLLYDSAQWPEGVLVRHYYDRHGSQHM